MKKTTIIFMLLFCFTGYSQLIEFFDDASVVAPVAGSGIWELPSGTWQIFDNEVGDVDWTINPDMTYPAASGQYAAFINRENIGDGNTSEDYFASPLITIPENPQLRFVTRSTSSVDYGTILEVRAAPGSADPSDISAYTTLISSWSETTLSTIYSEKVVDLPADIEGENTMYIAFVKIYTQDGDAIGGERWLVDNVKVIPKCPSAQNVVIVPLSDSFVVSWDQTDVSEWQVGVFPVGDNIEQGEPFITSSTTNVVLTQTTTLTPVPLQPGTTYKIMIMGICEYGPSDQYESDFVITQLTPPQCGELFTDSGGTLENYGPFEDAVTTICPENPDELVTITFTAFGLEAGGMDRMYIYDGFSVFAPIIASENPAGIDGEGLEPGAFWGTENPGTIEASNESGCLTFHFTSDGSDGNYLGWQAEVSCIPIPSCQKPTQFIAGVPTDISVVTDWIPVGIANTWKVYALPCGSPEPTFETPGGLETTIHPFEVTGLNPNTCYDLYVISMCSEEEGSDPSLKKTRITQVAPPTCGGIFTDTGGPNGNYPTISDSVVTICPENEGEIVTVSFIEFSISPQTHGLYVHNGNSVATPIIPSENGPGITAGLELSGAFWGSVLPGTFESWSADGCLTFHFISNDWSQTAPGWIAEVSCGPPPSCRKPISVKADNSGQNNVMVTWTEIGTASEWQVIVVPFSDPIPIDSTPGWQSATSQPFLYEGLQPGTHYKAYVRAICSDDDVSIPSYPGSFFTVSVNDECTGAIELVVNGDVDCEQIITVVFEGATSSAQTTCDGLTVPDVWCKFTSTATEHSIRISNTAGYPSTAAAVLYSGDCDALVPITCLDDFYGGNAMVENLIPGETYYLQFFDFDTVAFDICLSIVLPPISIDNEYTAEQLVNDVLIDSSCNLVSNITHSSGIESDSMYGIAYFNKSGSDLGLDEGVLLSTCNVLNTPGPNTSFLHENIVGDTWDGDLEAANFFATALGITPLYGVNNASKIEFDFVPSTSEISFQYIYASEGYGYAQCHSTTTFAFILTDLTTAADPVNYAVLPNSDLPIAEATIRDQVYDITTGCESVNAEYFGKFYGAFDFYGAFIPFLPPTAISPFSSPTNFNGLTAPLTAKAPVIPGHTYHIKLVVTKMFSTKYDAGVFIGKFNTSNIDLGGEVVSSCGETPYEIQSGLDPDDYTFIWKNGEELLEGEVSASLVVTEPGAYTVEAILNGTECLSSGIVTVTFSDEIILEEEDDISVCGNYTLSSPAIGHYYTEPNGQGDIIDGDMISQIGMTTIYVYATNDIGCSGEDSFIVTISPVVELPAIANVDSCQPYTLPLIPGVIYYNGAGATGGIITTVNSTQQVFAYLTGSTGNCFAEQSFIVTINTPVVLAPIPDVVSCGPYALPLVEELNYYSGPNATGNTLVTINMTQQVYAYLAGDAPGCSAQQEFTVTVNNIPSLNEIEDVISCSAVVLPTIEGVTYYNGSNATGGTLTSVAATQEVYAYLAGASADCSAEQSFTVTINDAVSLAPIPDVVSCGQYVLPTLEGVNYYSGPDATGEVITSVTATQQVFAYLAAATPACSAQQSFTVTITDLPELPEMDDVVSCGIYTLPAIPGIVFYSQPAATGNAINSVNATQAVYAFSAGATADCWAEESFTVTVVEAPQLEILAGCQGNDYVLEVVVTNNDLAGYTFSWNTADGNIVSGSASNSVVVSGEGTYSVEVTLGQDDCDGQAQTFVAGTTCMIQKGISVNGDGKNDFFDLDGFNVQKIEIFNRYGMKVYERSPYTNQWNGQSDKGQELPDGAYYYVIGFEAGNQRTGWIYVNREN